MSKICIIEDDESIRNLICMALTHFGYDMLAYERGEEALHDLENEKPDMLIVDWMLPGIDGLEVVRKVRQIPRFKTLPIMFLTAKDGEYDKVLGLDNGSDDYMTKPFSILELSARVRSLLRRSQMKEEHILSFKDLIIDEGKREVSLSGQPLALTYKEYELLVYLMKHDHKVVLREELLHQIWGYDYEGESRTLDMHIKSLRKKLGETYAKHIKTIRSVGYRFIFEEIEA